MFRYSDGNTFTDCETREEAERFQKLQNGGTITEVGLYRLILVAIPNPDADVFSGVIKEVLEFESSDPNLGIFKAVDQLEQAEEHSQDSDCCESIDIQTDTCTVCHVYHGDPCLDCGARAYHKPTCPRLSQDDNRVFAAQTFE